MDWREGVQTLEGVRVKGEGPLEEAIESRDLEQMTGLCLDYVRELVLLLQWRTLSYSC